MSNQPLKIDGLLQVALTVKDLARSKDFYQHKLGLTHLFDAGVMSFFQVGNVRLMLGTSSQIISCAGAILYYKVGDLTAAYETLMEQGVTFIQKPHLVAPMPDHDLWLALLRDPDENAVGLMAEVPRAKA
jgi:methylmalonyl-CoA/ethylmalonyl-CoA epimerase